MEKYDLFNNNCNNFSNECSEFLVSKPIPEHITGSYIYIYIYIKIYLKDYQRKYLILK
jgi:hypothetical protein